MYQRRLQCILYAARLCALLVIIAGSAWAADADRAQMLTGVRSIASPGTPGNLALFGPEAFTVVVGKGISPDRGTVAPVVAATRMGQGRVVAFGHDGYFSQANIDIGDTGPFLLNAVRWSVPNRASPRVGVASLGQMLAFLQKSGMTASAANLNNDLSAFDVLVMTHSTMTAAVLPKVTAFVNNGGGLLVASTGWGWQQITGLAIWQHPGSQVTGSAGIIWANDYLGKTVAEGFGTTGTVPRFVHAGEALDALLAVNAGGAALPAGDAAQAVDSISLAIQSLPLTDTLFLPRIRSLRTAAGVVAVPTPQQPVSAANPIARVVLLLDTAEAERAPAAEVQAHPAAAVFPGAVPADAPRVTRNLTLDTTKYGGWISTGLYAVPGVPFQVSIPDTARTSGLSVRIGTHTDELWNLARWERVPAIIRTYALTTSATTAASAFGGPIYFQVTGDRDIGNVSVVVAGVVEAPYFKLGETHPEEWRQSIRLRPGPWAELAGDKVSMIVPSSAIRALEDPTALTRFWDEVADKDASLAAWPLARRRPERMVTDQQISAGYMHSGYPIMTHLDVAGLVVDEPKLRKEGSWGHFHELGHNHQHTDWTFDGTGEVTVNLFSMYSYDKVLGQPFDAGHPDIRDRVARNDRLRKYLKAGAVFAQWKQDPFLALTMYIQLIDGFGWGPFERLFAEYRALAAADRPKNDDEKRDQWLVRFSRAVGRNLGPFFQAWGVPTSATARATVANLPGWMPADWPSP